jgi:hypothetical protein
MKLTANDEIAARLTMLEFAIEVMAANALRFMPEADASGALKTFVDRFDRSYGVMTGDPLEAQRIVATTELAKANAARLAEKIERRLQEFRAKK